MIANTVKTTGISLALVLAATAPVRAQNFGRAKEFAKKAIEAANSRQPIPQQAPKPQEPKPQPTTRPEQVLSVEEIVEKTNHVSYYQGKDGRAKVEMEIVDSRGRKRVREFIILRWDEPAPQPATAEAEDKPQTRPAAPEPYDADQKLYVYFERPADVNKMAFLVWKHVDQHDDRWLYLPAVDLVKRIAPADKRTSFVGSDFFYEDVSGRSINEDHHELLETTKDYYVLKNTPKDPSLVEFAYFKTWIRRESFIPVKISYYDQQGKEYRRYQALGVREIQGFKTVTKSRMTNLRSGGYTILEYREVQYNVGLEEDVFAERHLRRPPYEYLRSNP